MKKIRSHIGYIVVSGAALVPHIVLAQQSFRDVVNNILLPILNLMVSAIIAITILVIMWNGVQMIVQADNTQKRANSRAMMMWSVIVLFIMIAIWGIIGILQQTFGV